MQQAFEYVALAIGSLAALVIIYGVATGMVALVRAELRRSRSVEGERSSALERVRYDTGFHLILGLELLIAADIIRTVVKPSLQELAILGGIVVIRTVLSYFLGREIGRHRPEG